MLSVEKVDKKPRSWWGSAPRGWINGCCCCCFCSSCLRIDWDEDISSGREDTEADGWGKEERAVMKDEEGLLLLSGIDVASLVVVAGACARRGC